MSMKLLDNITIYRVNRIKTDVVFYKVLCIMPYLVHVAGINSGFNISDEKVQSFLPL